MVGLMDDSTPQAPALTRNHFRCSEPSQPWRRSLAQSSGDGSGGGGGVMGVAKVRLGGWVGVGPCTCPPPRLSTPGIQSRQEQTGAWGGEVGEGAGKIRAS